MIEKKIGNSEEKFRRLSFRYNVINGILISQVGMTDDQYGIIRPVDLAGGGAG